MLKIISIHQPCYLPWLGFFHKLLVSDEFVILDHVQFEKNSFINRNKILQPDGRPMWLTVPVLTKGNSQRSISDVKINPGINWTKKHSRAVELCYSKTPYYGEAFKELFSVADRDITYLRDLLAFSLGWLVSGTLDLPGLALDKVYFSSIFKPPLQETKSALVLEICQRLGADVYLSGQFGRDYLDLDAFKAAGIKVVFQSYSSPVYKQHQLKDDVEFVPNMSVLDLLFNHGPMAEEIIMSTNETREDLLREPS